MTFRHYFVLTFLYLLYSFSGFANCDTNVINKLNDKAFDLAYSAPLKGLKLADEIILKSEKCGFQIGVIRAHIRKGICYDVMNNIPQSIHSYEKALSIAKQINYKKGIASSENNLGLIYWKLGETQTAQKYFQKALNVFKEIEDWENAGNASNNLGLIMEEFGIPKKAIEWYNRSLNYYKKTNSDRPVYNTFSNLSNAYITLEKYDSSLLYVDKALKGFRKINSTYDIGIALNNYGLVQSYLGNHEKALKSYDEARKVDLAVGNKYSYIGSTLNYAITLGELGRIKEEEKYLLPIYKQAVDLNSNEMIYKVSLELAKVNFIKGNTKEGNRYLNIYKRHNTAFYKEQNFHDIAKMESIYSVKEEKEKNNEYKKAMMLKLEQQRTARNLDNTIWISVVVGFILIGLLAFFINRKRSLQKKLFLQQEIYEATNQERKRISFELHDLVGSQLSFVVSNLEMLNYSIPENERVSKTFNMSQEAMGSLRDTVWALNNEQITSQVLVERMRNIKYKWFEESEIQAEIKEELIGNQFFDPAVTLHIMRIFQEAINNIFKHSKASKVNISIKETHESLHLSIHDNGIGFDEQKHLQFNYGLKSMKDRADKIGAELKVNGILNEGTKVELNWSKNNSIA